MGLTVSLEGDPEATMRKTLSLFVTAVALSVLALALSLQPPRPEPRARRALSTLPSDIIVRSSPSLELTAQLLPRGRSLILDLQARRLARPATRGPIAVGLLVDRSGSMEGAALERARRQAMIVLSTLRDDDRVALVSFGSSARADLPLMPVRFAKRRLARLLEDLEAGGGSNLSAGFRLARHVLARGGTSAELLLLTDGGANQGLTDPAELERLVREDAARLSAIELGEGADHALLARLVAADGGQIVRGPTPDASARLGATLGLRPQASEVALSVEVGGRQVIGSPLDLGALAEGQSRQVRLAVARPEHAGSFGTVRATIAGKDGPERVELPLIWNPALTVTEAAPSDRMTRLGRSGRSPYDATRGR